ncbi:hypothetical protein BIW11_13760 [Tropilaelaps mercedesae]|uniref:RalBP1-associated Eps domain-containing protein 1-like n=1 Tax=Tropilaelaps mercedesae TaxID=418985 RepID=A0A1V9X0F2_9ACAR|nr:hypothetical protein BIW11_13760 [Tropilaelaps mercedesae]
MDNGGALGGVTSYQPPATAAAAGVGPPTTGSVLTAGVQLSAEEHALYEELFAALDVGGDERIQGSQASVLLRAANLPTETLQLITELSGAKRVGHFGRSQFFRALKLIAGAQNGLKPSCEVLAAPLPLPKLNMAAAQHTASTLLLNNNNNNNNNNNTPSANNCYGAAAATVPTGGENRSPEQQQVASACAPDPEKTWASFHCPDDEWNSSRLFLQQLHVSSEEQRHLLAGGGGEDPEIESELGGPGEADEVEDGEGIWTITREQRAYYVKQFAGMQSDLERGKIQGRQAKEFFEKSRLPVVELSRIWHLADIDRDGQLALDEFCTAMHLVVLRRNGIHLPSQLPPQLLPDIPPLIQTSPLPLQQQQRQPLVTAAGSVTVPGSAISQTQHLDGSSHHSLPTHHHHSQHQHISTKSSTTNDTNATAPAGRDVAVGAQGVGAVTGSSPLSAPTGLSKQWMKFSPSPTSGSLVTQKQQSQHKASPPASEVGTGPVSFDFSTTLVNQDPRILHPVARRPPSSPECQISGGPFSCDATPNRPTGSIVADPTSAGTGGYVIMNNSSETDHDGLDVLDALSANRPHLISPNRGHHARSSSLDLNPRASVGQLSSGTPLKGLFPPAVPPRSSPANGMGATGGSGGVARSLSGDSSRGGISQVSGSSSSNPPPKIGATGGAFQLYSGKTRTAQEGGASESGAALSGGASDSSCTSSSSSCNSSYEDLSLDPTTDDAAMLLVDDDHTECGYLDATQQVVQGHLGGQGSHLHRPHHRKHDLPDAMMAQFISEIPVDREQLIRDIGAHRERNAMLCEWNRELHEELQQLIQERLSLQSQKQPTSTI